MSSSIMPAGSPFGGVASFLPLLLPFVERITVPIGGFDYPIGPTIRELVDDLKDGRIDGQEAKRLVFVTVSSASHLLERPVVIAGRTYNFTPLVRKLAASAADGELTQEEVRDLLPELIVVVAASRVAPKVASPQPIVITVLPISAVSTPVPVPPAPGSQPATPAITGGGVVDIRELKFQLGAVEDPEDEHGGRRVLTPEDRVREVNTRGSTSHFRRGSRLHLNWTAVMDDGTELTPDDPRWANVNKGWSRAEDPLHGNEAVVFTGYEVDGRKTDGPNGEPGGGTHNENVSPESVVQDAADGSRPYGMTPTHLINLTGGAKYRATAVYKRNDGRKVFGIGGRGNSNGPDAEPFTFEG